MADQLLFVVDDDPNLRRILTVLLEARGYRVQALESGKQCLERLDENPAVIFLDMIMPGLNGIETLKKLKRAGKEIPVIMLTSVDDVETAVEVIKLGAYDYMVKPYDEARLITSLAKAIEQNALVKKVRHLEGELKGLHDLQGIVGKSAAIQKVLEKVNKVKDSWAGVLILGESGTGKELIARAIHYNSPFSQGLFVDINCGAIPETLQESELFGHKKGAFTGAVESRTGKLEMADGGTLFLDEVAEMSLQTQTKLLRFLQEKNFERVGENSKISIHARVIAATNKDLKLEVEKGNFREDLYYRLAVFPILVPPLRERREDIPLLCHHVLRKFGKELKKEVCSITPEAMQALSNYPWPGNVRQLENTLFQAMINTGSSAIGKGDLPAEVLEKKGPPKGREGKSSSGKEGVDHPQPEAPVAGAGSAPEKIIPFKEVEKQTLARALKVTGGNIPQAARELGLSRSTLYRLVKKYGLH